MEPESLNLDLEAFQGPFDLLLHLIREMEVDINDIPMQEITSQYLAYIQEMSTLQLDRIGDYLVMASTLIEIKSSMLLPTEPDPDFDDEFLYEDPRTGLVQQLLLYQQFQSVAEEFQIKESVQSKHYFAPAQDLSHYQEVVPLKEGDVDLEQLTFLMESVLIRAKEREPLTRQVEAESITVDDKVQEILESLRSVCEPLEFSHLTAGHSKIEIITAFMAVLELIRRQRITFTQPTSHDPLMIQEARKELAHD